MQADKKQICVQKDDLQMKQSQQLKSTPPSKNSNNFPIQNIDNSKHSPLQSHLSLSAKNDRNAQNNTANHNSMVGYPRTTSNPLVNNELSLSSDETGHRNGSKSREPTLVRFTLDNQEVIEVAVPNFLGSLSSKTLDELCQLGSRAKPCSYTEKASMKEEKIDKTNEKRSLQKTQSPFSSLVTTYNTTKEEGGGGGGVISDNKASSHQQPAYGSPAELPPQQEVDYQMQNSFSYTERDQHPIISEQNQHFSPNKKEECEKLALHQARQYWKVLQSCIFKKIGEVISLPETLTKRHLRLFVPKNQNQSPLDDIVPDSYTELALMKPQKREVKPGCSNQSNQEDLQEKEKQKRNSNQQNQIALISSKCHQFGRNLTSRVLFVGFANPRQQDSSSNSEDVSPELDSTPSSLHDSQFLQLRCPHFRNKCGIRRLVQTSSVGFSTFATAREMHEHNLKISEAYRFRCESTLCMQRFKTKQQMQNHFTSLHSAHENFHINQNSTKQQSLLVNGNNFGVSIEEKFGDISGHQSAVRMAESSNNYPQQQLEQNLLQSEQVNNVGAGGEKLSAQEQQERNSPFGSKKLKYRCPICLNKQFISKCKLDWHLKCHERQFTCDIDGCNKQFKQKQHLKNHMLTHQDDVRPWVCKHDGCGKSFKSVSHLKDHTQSIHMKLKPFECVFCKSSFSRNSSLKYHIKTIHVHLIDPESGKLTPQTLQQLQFLQEGLQMQNFNLETQLIQKNLSSSQNLKNSENYKFSSPDRRQVSNQQKQELDEEMVEVNTDHQQQNDDHIKNVVGLSANIGIKSRKIEAASERKVKRESLNNEQESFREKSQEHMQIDEMRHNMHSQQNYTHTTPLKVATEGGSDVSQLSHMYSLLQQAQSSQNRQRSLTLAEILAQAIQQQSETGAGHVQQQLISRKSSSNSDERDQIGKQENGGRADFDLNQQTVDSGSIKLPLKEYQASSAEINATSGEQSGLQFEVTEVQNDNNNQMSQEVAPVTHNSHDSENQPNQQIYQNLSLLLNGGLSSQLANTNPHQQSMLVLLELLASQIVNQGATSVGLPSDQPKQRMHNEKSQNQTGRHQDDFAVADSQNSQRKSTNEQNKIGVNNITTNDYQSSRFGAHFQRAQTSLNTSKRQKSPFIQHNVDFFDTTDHPMHNAPASTNPHQLHKNSTHTKNSLHFVQQLSQQQVNNPRVVDRQIDRLSSSSSPQNRQIHPQNSSSTNKNPNNMPTNQNAPQRSSSRANQNTNQSYAQRQTASNHQIPYLQQLLNASLELQNNQIQRRRSSSPSFQTATPHMTEQTPHTKDTLQVSRQSHINTPSYHHNQGVSNSNFIGTSGGGSRIGQNQQIQPVVVTSTNQRDQTSNKNNSELISRQQQQAWGGSHHQMAPSRSGARGFIRSTAAIPQSGSQLRSALKASQQHQITSSVMSQQSSQQSSSRLFQQNSAAFSRNTDKLPRHNNLNNTAVPNSSELNKNYYNRNKQVSQHQQQIQSPSNSKNLTINAGSFTIDLGLSSLLQSQNVSASTTNIHNRQQTLKRVSNDKRNRQLGEMNGCIVVPPPQQTSMSSYPSPMPKQVGGVTQPQLLQTPPKSPQKQMFQFKNERTSRKSQAEDSHGSHKSSHKSIL